MTLLEDTPNISRSSIAKQLSISNGSVRHHIEKLKEDGKIRREGSDKGGFWVVIKK
jgi:predicted HTH transcriptional regulator